MDLWKQTCLLLCMYGFFKELRPSEPFLTEYLLGPQQNLTENQVYHQIYPVWTYSYLSLLIAVFLLTDLLRYKPVIIFEGVGYVVTWCFLLWARGVPAMQFVEFAYGIATSTEVAYYTYIYAKVPHKFYQKVTSYTRVAILIGRFMSGVLSQVLTSSNLMDYHSLNYISLTCVSIAFLIACFLPSASTSIYFHRHHHPTSEEDNHIQLTEERPKDTLLTKASKVPSLIWKDFTTAYSNKYLLKWSIWWAFATCGNFQVGNYIQPLWETIAPMDETESLYNGVVEAVQTLLSALAALGVGYLHLNWELFGEATLALVSVVDGIILIFMGYTEWITVAYVNYVLFRASYQVMITVASYQVAKQLRVDSYGLVFGINMFLSLLMQSLLTLVVVQVLEIGPRLQFVIYGVYFLILAFLFFVLSAFTCGKLGCDGMRKMGMWEVNSVPSKEEPPVERTMAVQEHQTRLEETERLLSARTSSEEDHKWQNRKELGAVNLQETHADYNTIHEL